MTRLRSFAPLARADARVLILGSMPGVASLEAQQYYAHPRNAFWPIMLGLFGIDPAWPYPDRCAALLNQRIAVWDVLKYCQRPGSLDAAIRPDSIVANDFPGFFSRHRQVAAVFFNGAAAERLFKRHAYPHQAPPSADKRIYKRLPSTSPAHAAMSLQQKLDQWQSLRESSGIADPDD